MRMPLLALLIALDCTQARAELPSLLSQDDVEREALYTVLHVVDWSQTRSIAREPARWEEKNLVLGTHPSAVRVNRYMGATLLAHWSITYALPSRYRPVWQYGTITLEAFVVGRNAHLGIRARF